ncbi:MAG: MBL fold metallo-hydrolase [Gammaproteobacteria bacterium]|nr:MBL fold metallo-hydrolase [Gammaproteobacteria bacterium]
MTPTLQPFLVNGPFGDPVVYVDFRFARRALLFDLGDIQSLPARKILRLTHIFVSHAHMDHFMGFDRIVRICLGRPRSLALFGPPGFIDRVEHKLAAYTWNLVENYITDFMLEASELYPSGELRTARFRCRSGFRREDLPARTAADGVLLEEDNFRVLATMLDHRTPCLGFAVEERQHINIWKNRLTELGLPTGPWLSGLKAAVHHGEPDDTAIRVSWTDSSGRHERTVALGELRRQVLHLVPGQKIAYIVDIVYHEENVRRVLRLAHHADCLFIEAVFLHRDAEHAARKYHLTARQAGALGRASGARHLVPMHFSARYTGGEAAIYREIEEAYSGNGELSD